MKDYITYIPKYNQTPERMSQIYAICDNAIVCDNLKDFFVNIIRKKRIIVEIWYPHHFIFLYLAKVRGHLTVFSPVICNYEWFTIALKENLLLNLYTVRRVRMLVMDFLAGFVVDIVFVQDDEFIKLWKKVLPKNVKIYCVHNKFKVESSPRVDLNNRYDRKNNAALIVSHDSVHKIQLLNELLKKVPNSWTIYWAGNVGDDFKNKHPNIVFLGRVDRDELDSFYRKVKILLIPSIYEGSPRVVYECALYGVKILSFDLVGLRTLKNEFPDMFLDYIKEHEGGIYSFKDVSINLDRFNCRSETVKIKALNEIERKKYSYLA
jgi:hypothetical protein